MTFGNSNLTIRSASVELNSKPRRRGDYKSSYEPTITVPVRGVDMNTTRGKRSCSMSRSLEENRMLRADVSMKMELKFWIMIIGLIMTQAVITSAETSSSTKEDMLCSPGQSYNTDLKRCCTLCAPGQGVQTECSLTNDTLCERCDRGSNFSSEYSSIAKCKACSACGRNERKVQLCGSDRDVICQCDYGFYWSKLHKKCERCIECKPGYGATQACDHHQNTICRRCPAGTYSQITDSNSGCVVCQACDDDEEELRSCNATSNTICRTRRTLSGSHSNELLESSAPPPRNDIIYLYCSIMAGVILLLIVYVIIQHFRQRKRRNGGSTCGSDDVKNCKNSELNTSLLLPGSNCNNQTFKSIKSPLISIVRKNDVEMNRFHPDSYSTSGVYTNTSTGSQMMNNAISAPFAWSFPIAMKVADLPPLMRREVEKQLVKESISEDGAPSWIKLAKHLGFEQPLISSFDNRAKAAQDNTVAAKYVLTEWSRANDNATVGVLIRALKKIGRKDIAKMLRGQRESFTTQCEDFV